MNNAVRFQCFREIVIYHLIMHLTYNIPNVCFLTLPLHVLYINGQVTNQVWVFEHHLYLHCKSPG